MRLSPLILVPGLVAALGLPPPAAAQSPRMVRVDVQFQHSGIQRDEGVQGRGGVIIMERGTVRPHGRIGARDGSSVTTVVLTAPTQ